LPELKDYGSDSDSDDEDDDEMPVRTTLPQPKLNNDTKVTGTNKKVHRIENKRKRFARQEEEGKKNNTVLAAAQWRILYPDAQAGTSNVAKWYVPVRTGATSSRSRDFAVVCDQRLPNPN